MIAETASTASNTDITTLIVLALTGIATSLVKAWIDHVQRKAAAEKIADVKTVATSTHKLVNGNMGAVLAAKATLARRVANLTADPADVRDAEIAEQLATAHAARCAAAGDAPPPPSGERGFVGVSLLAGVVCVGLALALGMSACGTAHIESDDPRTFHLGVDSGPPCEVVLQDADGKMVSEFTGRLAACEPEVTRRWLCRRWRAVLAPGEADPTACAGVLP